LLQGVVTFLLLPDVSVLGIGVVDKPLLLEEVTASSLTSMIDFVILIEGVVLNVDLALVALPPLRALLQHSDESQQLSPLDLLWIEIVGFRYVQVRYDVLWRLRFEHQAVEQDVVVELLIAPLLKVVNNGQLRRVVLQH